MPAPLQSPMTGRHRLASLDALRASAMLLVLVVHSALSYTTLPIPNLLWGAIDPERSFAFDLIFWATLSLSMPAFFTMSGLVSAKLFDERGPAGFAGNRFRKVFLPLLFGGAVVLPFCLYSWAYGWLVTGRCNFREILRQKFHQPGLQENLYGPAHLWFLLYLVGFLGVYGLWRTLSDRLRPLRLEPGRWVGTIHSPIFLAIPTVLALWIGHQAQGTDPILNMRNTFVPDPYRFAHHAWFFLAGAWLFRARTSWDDWAVLAPRYLVIAALAFLVRASWLRLDLGTPGGVAGLDRWILVGSGAVFAWTGTFGFFGACLRWLSRESCTLRYVSDSSYWVYLTHFPVVGLIQADLVGVSAPAWLKFSIVLLLTTALCLGSYHALVRYTWLGRWLHGPRERCPSSSGHALWRRPHLFRSRRVEAR